MSVPKNKLCYKLPKMHFLPLVWRVVKQITISLNLFTHVSFITVTHCLVVTSQMGGSRLRERAREQVYDNK